jgi:glucosamine kinase
MILIADSGSTKTSWVLIDGKNVIQTINTIGYNPYYFKNDELLLTIKAELLPIIKEYKIEKIFFYGSGCSSNENCSIVSNSLSKLFTDSIIEIQHDLYGAALALLNDNEGIACILGTGSNSCYWDGKKIISNVPSVGYLLGDEGSGNYIGMKILKGILEEKAPDEIITKFYNSHNTTFDEVLNRIYNEEEPTRFISEVGKFAGLNINNSWIYSAVKQSFFDFIENQLIMYQNYQSLPVSFTGSIAYHFKKILLEACQERSIKVGKILKNPIDGLVSYHLTKISK